MSRKIDEQLDAIRSHSLNQQHRISALEAERQREREARIPYVISISLTAQDRWSYRVTRPVGEDEPRSAADDLLYGKGIVRVCSGNTSTYEKAARRVAIGIMLDELNINKEPRTMLKTVKR